MRNQRAPSHVTEGVLCYSLKRFFHGSGFTIQLSTRFATRAFSVFRLEVFTSAKSEDSNNKSGILVTTAVLCRYCSLLKTSTCSAPGIIFLSSLAFYYITRPYLQTCWNVVRTPLWWQKHDYRIHLIPANGWKSWSPFEKMSSNGSQVLLIASNASLQPRLSCMWWNTLVYAPHTAKQKRIILDFVCLASSL